MLGGTNVVPVLSVPAAGAKTNLKPIFQWSTINSASKYDLLVATDTAFTDIVIDKTGDNAADSNAWESDILLKNDTTYYWKVKARSQNSFGGWSAVGAFITEPAPVTTTTTQTTATTSTTDSPTTTTETTTSTTTTYPDASNTGGPAGVTLTPSGSLVITKAGACPCHDRYNTNNCNYVYYGLTDDHN